MFLEESSEEVVTEGSYEGTQAEVYDIIMETDSQIHNIEMSMIRLEHTSIVNEDEELFNEGVKEFFQKILDAIKQFIGKAIDWFKQMFRKLTKVFERYQKYYDENKDTISSYSGEEPSVKDYQYDNLGKMKGIEKSIKLCTGEEGILKKMINKGVGALKSVFNFFKGGSDDSTEAMNLKDAWKEFAENDNVTNTKSFKKEVIYANTGRSENKRNVDADPSDAEALGMAMKFKKEFEEARKMIKETGEDSKKKAQNQVQDAKEEEDGDVQSAKNDLANRKKLLNVALSANGAVSSETLSMLKSAKKRAKAIVKKAKQESQNESFEQSTTGGVLDQFSM